MNPIRHEAERNDRDKPHENEKRDEKPHDLEDCSVLRKNNLYTIRDNSRVNSLESTMSFPRTRESIGLSK